MCEYSYKYCGNTTNVHYHLKEHHPILYKVLSNGDIISSSSSSTHVASVPREQQKLPKLFKQQEAFPCSSSKWIKLTESLCYFLVKDTLTFDTVNGIGFQKFYKIWSQGTSLQTGKLYPLYTCQGSTNVRKNQFFKSCTVVEHLDSPQICGHQGLPIYM